MIRALEKPIRIDKFHDPISFVTKAVGEVIPGEKYLKTWDFIELQRTKVLTDHG